MSKYLKEKQEYIDLYDRLTVDDCRWREKFHKNYKAKDKNGEPVLEELGKTFSEIALHYDLLFTTIKWYEDKEKTISEWIDRDKRKDELYENTSAPRDIRCLKCYSLTKESSKILVDGYNNNEDRILFMYDCPNGCLPHRAFYNNGEEYKTQPNLCPNCKTELKNSKEEIKNEKIIILETCPNCEYEDKKELDISIKEKPYDPEYEKDRERFCLSGEALTKNLSEKSQLESIGKFMDSYNEKQKNKDIYDEVEKIKKVTVFNLEELLKPVCEKDGYVKFQFEKPEIGKDLIVSFMAQDSRSNRTELESSYTLKKILKRAVSDTNWRLMSDGVSYRMGILSGRLRAYEREEDLLELAKNRLNKK